MVRLDDELVELLVLEEPEVLDELPESPYIAFSASYRVCPELDEDVDVEFSSALISIAGATVSSNNIHAVSVIAPQNFKIFLAVSIYDTSSSS